MTYVSCVSLALHDVSHCSLGSERGRDSQREGERETVSAKEKDGDRNRERVE